jgi:hypothetical protein
MLFLVDLYASFRRNTAASMLDPCSLTLGSTKSEAQRKETSKHDPIEVYREFVPRKVTEDVEIVEMSVLKSLPSDNQRRVQTKFEKVFMETKRLRSPATEKKAQLGTPQANLSTSLSGGITRYKVDESRLSIAMNRHECKHHKRYRTLGKEQDTEPRDKGD